MIKIGDGATIHLYTDRKACTVISVSKSGKSAVIQADTATRTDSNGMSDCQDYAYTANPNGSTYKVRLNKDGRWRVSKGQELGGSGVGMGFRRAYHDYTF